MKILKSFKLLTRFELCLWISSVIVVSLSYLLSPDKNILSILVSVIGVTALIFIAKGLLLGQFLGITFAILYGVISFFFKYYGETMTYLLMSAPTTIAATIQWYKNPYKKTMEVEVNKISKKQLFLTALLSLAVTFVFYFILKALYTTNLIFSTISVATSFFAASLTYLRSPYYALAYAANDIVLIVLWILASIADHSYIPMIFCFVMFLFNDLYGYINWKRMMKKQNT